MLRRVGGKPPQFHREIEEALRGQPFPAAADNQRGNEGPVLLGIIAHQGLQCLGHALDGARRLQPQRLGELLVG